ncbi:hypothetical protein AVEN_78416-1 [Araneus ventricosus]|uniref:Uncharacterized protein n=1 Tax=Araneus ventricosus TaxID=182803 RepID=A0A4Y2IYT1_ARAVE|nr:hypothetical protein AVEN_78416-1 [Araneus ventricosus]
MLCASEQKPTTGPLLQCLELTPPRSTPQGLRSTIGRRAGVECKFGPRVPVQVLSSSSDRGSKVRGPSQNSPRFASQRDINITKLR